MKPIFTKTELMQKVVTEMNKTIVGEVKLPTAEELL